MENHDKLLGLIDGIYEAALDADRWPQVLGEITHALGAAAVYLMAIDLSNRMVTFSLNHKIPDEAVRDYEDHYVTICPRIGHYQASPENRIVYDYVHSQEGDIDRSEYYAWLRRFGFRYYLGAPLINEPGYSSIVTFQRSPRQGHVDGGEVALLEALLPHLQRAMQLRQRIEDLDLRRAAVDSAVDCLGFGLILVGDDGRIVLLNRVATEITNALDGVMVDRYGLHTMARTERGSLQGLIRDAINVSAGLPGAPGGSMAVTRPSGKRPYAVLVMPLSRRNMTFARQRPAALVFVTDPERSPDIPQAQLGRLYRLTPAEARLTAAIVAGQSLAEYADSARVIMNTARWRLKQVLAKTNTRSQAKLVGLIHRSMVISARLS